MCAALGVDCISKTDGFTKLLERVDTATANYLVRGRDRVVGIQTVEFEDVPPSFDFTESRAAA
jgi:hypothetical protein